MKLGVLLPGMCIGEANKAMIPGISQLWEHMPPNPVQLAPAMIETRPDARGE